MNLSFFISKRLNYSDKNSFSSTIHKVAVVSIAVGIATMIVSFLILQGFQQTIRDKIFSFGAHMEITKFVLYNTYEESPLSTNEEFYQNYKKLDYVEHMHPFSYKAGLLKTDQEVMGVILKGVNKDFYLKQFDKNLIKGNFINFSDSSYSTEVVISKKIANTLKLDTGSQVVMFFIQDPPRYRRLTIKGIYETGLEDFDEKVIMGDIGLIQRLNNWPDSLVGGFEVYIKDFNKIDEAEEKLAGTVGFDKLVEKVSDRYIQIFDWLSLLNRNVVIFLSLILFVACFNMISILLILIMERTPMIGLLKAMGSTNEQIREIFMINGMMMIVKGLVWGNVIGVGFGVLQSYFKIIPLDPENYYMSYVPISWNIEVIAILNLLVFLLTTLVLLIPTMIISRINPIRAIRYD